MHSLHPCQPLTRFPLPPAAPQEVVDPAAEGYAEQAAKIFWRDGFVAIRDVLSPEQVEAMRSGCDKTIRGMMASDGARVGNRGGHRYSFGSAPGHFGCQEEWSVLIDPPVLMACLDAIFQSPDWSYAHGAASGGDFVLPGAVEYQPLHRDTGDYLKDPSGRVDFRDMPCASITVNFPMEVAPHSKVGHSGFNGVTRQIPGTQKSREPLPGLEDEPRWMKLSTVNPVPAGSCCIRDQRAWHGGTPNLSTEVRAIPHFGAVLAPWYQVDYKQTLPRHIYDRLTEAGQRACRHIVCDEGVEPKIEWSMGAKPKEPAKAPVLARI
eukprot:SAG22_NODE_3129_length_1915_cov_1.469714_3_plen_321_part_00